MEITPQLTRGLWRAMNEHYDTRVVHKEKSPLMKAASFGLHTIGIMERETFMERYTTAWGKRIYPWFRVGEGSQRDLWYQIVICVHEHQHIVQYRRDGLLRYSALYALNTRRRALLEAEAYRCNMEMKWWRHKKTGDPGSLANRLADYGCSKMDIRAARTYLEVCADEIRSGGAKNESSLFAIDWLERHVR